jgi:putative oxidoreductase
MDVGLLLIRFVVGGLLIGHGTQKLFGWFGGHGIDGTAQMFDSLGYRPPRAAAYGAGLSEAVGGALLFVGLLIPLGAAMVVGAMFNATVAVHLEKGVWAQNGGYELPLLYAVSAVAIAASAAGVGVALLAAVFGVAVGTVVLRSRQTADESVSA